MLYWLDKNTENNNVIVLSKKAILIGSCNRGLINHVETQLKKNANPVSLLGKDKVAMIPFVAIQEITHNPAETSSTLHCKGKRGIIKKDISFSQIEAKLKCLNILKKLQGGTLAINEEQSIRRVEVQPIKHTVKTEIPTLKTNFGKPKIANLLSKVQFDNNLLNKKNVIIGMAAAGVVGASLIGYLVFFGNSSALYDAIQAHTLKNTNDIVKLIDDGADIDYKGEDGVTPLLSALNNGDEKLAVKLIEKGADLDTDYFGQTALDVAIETNLDNAVITMLSKKAISSNKEDLLVRILQNEMNLQTVKAALANGGNVNYVDADGLSILANALLFEASDDVVKFLLDKGASTKTIVNGVSPVEFAMSRGKQGLASLLSKYSM